MHKCLFFDTVILQRDQVISNRSYNRIVAKFHSHSPWRNNSKYTRSNENYKGFVNTKLIFLFDGNFYVKFFDKEINDQDLNEISRIVSKVNKIYKFTTEFKSWEIFVPVQNIEVFLLPRNSHWAKLNKNFILKKFTQVTFVNIIN